MIKPLKLGLNADPPAIIVVYETNDKLRLRQMPLRNLWPTTSTKFVLEDLKTRHDVLQDISDSSLMRMIDIVKALKGGMSLEDALEKFKTTETTQNTEQNINKITSENQLKIPHEKANAQKEDELVDEIRPKPYSFLDKKQADEDTDFDPDDDLPLDEFEGNEDDFWR